MKLIILGCLATLSLTILIVEIFYYQHISSMLMAYLGSLLLLLSWMSKSFAQTDCLLNNTQHLIQPCKIQRNIYMKCSHHLMHSGVFCIVIMCISKLLNF